MGRHTETNSPQRPRSRFFLATASAFAAALGVALGGGIAHLNWLVPPVALPPTPSVSPAPEAVRTCTITDQLSNPDVLNVHALVTRSDTDEVLLQHAANDPTPSASVMKLVTAVTAMTVLGPDTRIPTSVYPGTEPGSVVIVGGGDVTLKSQDASVYQDAASMAQLAQQVQAAGGASRVGVDASLFSGPAWQPSWNDFDRRDGSTSPVTALMVDAGRADPTAQLSVRSTDPISDATNSFAGMLGAQVDTQVTRQPDSEPIAQVFSPPVSELVATMLRNSDNVIAESLARLVAIALGVGSDFSAINTAQRQVLQELGITVDGFSGVDGSGLSRDNRLTAQTIMGLLDLIASNEHGLGALRADLPVNATSGTLQERFVDLPAGTVTAKTGYTSQVYALAGFLQLTDGGQLQFVVFVTVPDPSSDAQITTLANMQAMDAMVEAIYRCGFGLRNG